jgi:hypothetical protein
VYSSVSAAVSPKLAMMVVVGGGVTVVVDPCMIHQIGDQIFEVSERLFDTSDQGSNS